MWIKFKNRFHLFFGGIARRLFLLSLALLGIAGCQEDSVKDLKIGTNVWPGYEPLYLARHLNYIDDSSVRLIEYSNATQVSRALLNRQIDVGALTLDEAIKLSGDLAIDVILVTDVSLGADVLIAQSSIEQPSELRGKRVGVESGALGGYFLKRFMDRYQFKKDEIDLLNVTVNEHFKAFSEGSVDAVVTFEPVKTALLRQSGNILFSSSDIPGEIVDVLVVRRDALEVNKGQIRAVVGAWFKALDYFSKQPQTAAELMAGRLKLAPEEVLTSFSGMSLPQKEENLMLLGGDRGSLNKVVSELHAHMVNAQLFESPSVDINLNNQFIAQ